jgi:TonB family protein
MNGPPTVPSGWTRGRFWCVVGVFCALQTGLIMLFAEREHAVPGTTAAPGHFRLLWTPLTADELAGKFFAIDPTVFPLPSLHGFSGRAWLRRTAQPFETNSEMEARAWLALDTARLGTNFPTLSRAKSLLPFGLADQRGPDLEPWPAFLTPERFKTQSIFEIRGELAGRKLNAPVELPSWPSAQLLSNSVVQIAVDSAGQVIAARLLARSGSAEADSKALDKARGLRFRPEPSTPPVWGEAVFEWQTVEPAKTGPGGAP